MAANTEWVQGNKKELFFMFPWWVTGIKKYIFYFISTLTNFSTKTQEREELRLSGHQMCSIHFPSPMDSFRSPILRWMLEWWKCTEHILKVRGNWPLCYVRCFRGWYGERKLCVRVTGIECWFCGVLNLSYSQTL